MPNLKSNIGPLSWSFLIMILELVCCKKWQKIVPDQLLDCGVAEGPEGFQTDFK